MIVRRPDLGGGVPVYWTARGTWCKGSDEAARLTLNQASKVLARNTQPMMRYGPAVTTEEP